MFGFFFHEKCKNVNHLETNLQIKLLLMLFLFFSKKIPLHLQIRCIFLPKELLKLWVCLDCLHSPFSLKRLYSELCDTSGQAGAAPSQALLTATSLAWLVCITSFAVSLWTEKGDRKQIRVCLTVYNSSYSEDTQIRYKNSFYLWLNEAKHNERDDKWFLEFPSEMV